MIGDPGPGTAVRLIDKERCGKVYFEACLEEAALIDDSTSSVGLPAFHGLSCPGRVVLT